LIAKCASPAATLEHGVTYGVAVAAASLAVASSDGVW
jgi:hypothetical protein